VRPGHKLYVEHYPAAPGRPTLFMANGLTFSTRDYENLKTALRQLDPGVGLVLWDMSAMGESLLEEAPITHAVPIETQVEDLHLLKRELGLTGRAVLAGLSYGGALALKTSLIYPNDFDQFVAIAPMLERLPDQDMWIRNMAQWHMMSAALFPANFGYFISSVLNYCLQNAVSWHYVLYPSETRSRADITEHYQKMLATADWLTNKLKPSQLPNPNNFEEVYDFYLRILIYSTYWIPEPTVLENPFKLEGIFRMVQGVKDWNAFKAARNLPPGKIHAIAAMDDEFVKSDRMNLFWEEIPRSARASFLRMKMSRHKVTNIWPKQTAAWLLQILAHNPDLNQGYIFEGNPMANEAIHDSIRIPLNKEAHCETFLGTVPEPK
jgi:pimeloyl-ACP methyl ester carboxylesterase